MNKRNINSFTRTNSNVSGYFIIIFSILMLITISINFFIAVNNSRTKINEYKTLSSKQVEIQIKLLQSHFDSIHSDLLFLPQLNEVLRYKETFDREDRHYIEKEFFEFIRSKKLYDQLRYIDHNGMEIVRINYNDGYPEIVEDKMLQDKSERYYFTESLSTPKGNIYCSPFDLNIEHGEIERPLKPMLRFGTPVVDSAGETTGVIILNYLGKTIIADFENSTRTYPGKFALINSEGYWLFDDDPENEWGFMYPSNNNNLSTDNPELWRQISRNERYQLLTKNALYTSATAEIFPDFKDKGLIILNTITFKEMGTELTDVIVPVTKTLSASALIIGIISLLLARAVEQRNRFKNELRRSALHDNLTGLPNRKLLTERGEQLRLQSLRYGQTYAVFFIDLDGFKNVNDTLGHEAGDVLLKKVAETLNKSIRAADTASRIGGDEFIILLPRITGKEDCIIVAEKILKRISEEFNIMGNKIRISSSIGIMLPAFNDDSSFEDILRKADSAMYEVKKTGKNNYTFFTP